MILWDNLKWGIYLCIEASLWEGFSYKLSWDDVSRSWKNACSHLGQYATATTTMHILQHLNLLAWYKKFTASGQRFPRILLLKKRTRWKLVSKLSPHHCVWSWDDKWMCMISLYCTFLIPLSPAPLMFRWLKWCTYPDLQPRGVWDLGQKISEVTSHSWSGFLQGSSAETFHI